MLLFADDTVCIADTISGLQRQLNVLQEISNDFKLIVNVTKTKVLVFTKGGRLSKVEQGFYNNSQIETVNGFSYVGVFFHNKCLCLKWLNPM